MKIRRVDTIGNATITAEVEFEPHEMTREQALRLLGEMMHNVAPAYTHEQQLLAPDALAREMDKFTERYNVSQRAITPDPSIAPTFLSNIE